MKALIIVAALLSATAIVVTLNCHDAIIFKYCVFK